MSTSEIMGTLSHIDGKLKALSADGKKTLAAKEQQIVELAGAIKYLEARVAEHDRTLTPTRKSHGLPPFAYGLAEGVAEAMRSGDAATATEFKQLRAEFRAIVADFSATLRTAEELNADHVSAAAHRLQRESAFHATNARGVSAGATKSTSFIDGYLLWECQK